MTFTLYPAIDLRHGQVVRLKYGDLTQQTTFSDDPVATAQRWVDAGAEWLHVINLDGAFDQAGAANWQVLLPLTQLGAKVQFGGGVRSLADIERALNTGVSRVVLGTVAVEEPELVAAALRHFSPSAIAIGIDAREGLVKTRGWQTETPLTALELAQHMAGLGIETIIHTDIGRDGVLVGVNAAATAHLAQATGLQFIASGGVASLADVQATHDVGLSGLIIGRALYEGKVDLWEAIRVAASREQLAVSKIPPAANR